MNNFNVTNGKSYKLTITPSNQSGNIKFTVNNDGTNLVVHNDLSSPLELYFVNGSNFRMFFDGTTTFNVDFEVSLKEVGQDWSLIGTATITENQANIVTTSAVTGISQTNILTVGKNYKLSYNIVSNNNGGLKISGNEIPSIVGDNTYYFTASVAALEILRNSGVTDITITNISVKEVGQDWTILSPWIVGNNVLSIDGSQVSNQYTSQVVSSLTSGSKYKLQYTVSNITAGQFRINVANTLGTYVSSNGTYEFVFNATSGTTLQLQASTTLAASVSNISLKEITDDTDLPRINYEGFSYQDSLGSELITNGNDTSNIVGLADNQNINIQSSFLTLNKTYKITFEIYDYVEGSIFLLRPNNLGAGTAVSANGTYSYTVLANASISLIFRTDGLSTTLKLKNISVKEYLGQEVVPDSGCGSWLLEPQSTNLIPYSEDFSNAAWAKSNVIITPNQGISPSGLNNAFKYVGSSISQNVQTTINVSSNYTYSFYVKTINSPFIRLRTSDGSCWFNMTTNAVATNTFASAEIKSIGNNWYRLSVTSSSFTSSNSFFIHPHATDNTTSEMNGAEFLLWGAQVENQSFSTSYIPTSGAANTRLQDIANNSGNSTLINSTEGVLYAEIAALSSPVDSPKNITISDGTVNNYVRIEYYQDGRVYGNVYDGTSVAANFVVNQLNFNKVAIQYSSSGSKLYVNGTGVDFASKIFTSNTLNTIQFSSAAADSNYFYGKAKALAVYKEALTDANLRSLTYPNPVATTFDLDFDTIAEQFTFTRGSEATFVNAQGLIESTASNDAPRIDYSTGEKAFLLENQSTNLITYSSDFSQSYWIKQPGVVATYNTTETLSPDGTYNATKFIGNGSTGVYKASIGVSGVVSRSVYLKSVSGTTTAIFKGPNTNLPTPITLTITNEWQRFELIGDNGSALQGLWIDDITSDGLYMWGAQLEQQSYATSYIPTSGASATRNQELCNNATPVINSEEGTLYAEMATLADTDSIYRAISVSDGTTSNRAIIRYNLGASDITFLYVKDGVASANIYHIGSEKASDFNKFAFSWKLNEFKVYLNGTQVGVTDTVGNVSNAFTKLSFNDGVANPFYGNTKGLKVYPKALADVQLEDLTS